jgi:TolB-like protein
MKTTIKLALSVLLITIFALGCMTTSRHPYRVTNFSRDMEGIYKLRMRQAAVLPFENWTRNDRASLTATEEFNLQLGKLHMFTLIERARVEELFREQDFAPERIDQATAVRIGKMLGVHAVVLGTVTNYEAGKVGISIKLVDVESGRQLWLAKDNINGRDSRVRALVDRRDHGRLANDVEFLTRILCQELAKTLDEQ